MDKEEVGHVYKGILFSHKKNEIMPLAATQMDLDIIILSEVRQTKTNIVWYCVYVDSIKTKKGRERDTKKLTYKTNQKTWKTNIWLPKGKSKGDNLGVWD